MGTLTNAVKKNNRRASLIALRNHLAKAIENTKSSRDIAALSKRLMEVMDKLESIPDPNATSKTRIQEQRERVSNRRGKS